ncbi:MAG: hypothetical protein IV100_21955 [Myxococcales bacterium]|nr:hypothetical protein [Myxococcales bacterium]
MKQGLWVRLWVLGPIGLLSATACEETVTVACGPGTVLAGERCVPERPPEITCGEGTISVDGIVCLPRLKEPWEFDDVGSEADVSPAEDTGPEPLDIAEEDAGDDIPACVPDCAFRECGGDGCGGSCGSCEDPTAPTCDEEQGVCTGTCVPDCYGKTCGDDGCGGTCGECGEGSTCHDDSWCTPEAWTCDPEYFADESICDCECGAVDVDCKEKGAFMAGCDPLEVCNAEGLCEDKVPADWTCDPYTFDAQDYCNCDCGVEDPDCGNPDAPIIGCAGQYDSCEQGACVACEAACDGKSCGSDGCGGSCGECDEFEVCHLGQCADPCFPTPLACEDAECGDDGCGGSCGQCDGLTEVCSGGYCEPADPEVADDSCYLRCQSYAPSGCGCYVGCAETGDCCVDYDQMCTCNPACGGKTCGDDGCGGSCGTCEGATPYCTDEGQCTGECTPACDGKSCGPDGCGGECGTCGASETCSFLDQCVPADWHCSMTYYGDGAFCDCGCGAPDPDCALGVDFVFGCPVGVDSCQEGICGVEAFCSSKAECTNNQWCIGLYLSAPGQVSGVCGWPWPDSAPPGAPCSASEECSTGCCLGATCRDHCGADGECPSSQRCLGFEVASDGSGTTLGLSGGCASVGGSAEGCDAQAACPVGERCLVFLPPSGGSPRFLCTGQPAGVGEPCNDGSCAGGLLCVSTSLGKDVCALPCPGGASDCQDAEECLPTRLSDRGTNDTEDDIMVNACTP